MNYSTNFAAGAAVLIAAAISAVVLAAPAAPTDAQEDDAPVLTFSNPGQDAVINEPAFFVQMCFEEPVNILDLDKGGDFSFSLTPPEDFPLGLRIVFQPDGQGLAIYPNNADADTPEGEWTLEYRLTTPETLTPTEGTLTWTVDPDGEATPQQTPPACIDSGFTAVPGPGDGVTPPSVVTTVTPADTGDETPDNDGDEDDDDGPDILLLALLTIGAAGAVGLIALIGFFVRRGVGYDPHRPGPDDEPHH